MYWLRPLVQRVLHLVWSCASIYYDDSLIPHFFKSWCIFSRQRSLAPWAGCFWISQPNNSFFGCLVWGIWATCPYHLSLYCVSKSQILSTIPNWPASSAVVSSERSSVLSIYFPASIYSQHKLSRNGWQSSTYVDNFLEQRGGVETESDRPSVHTPQTEPTGGRLSNTMRTNEEIYIYIYMVHTTRSPGNDDSVRAGCQWRRALSEILEWFQCFATHIAVCCQKQPQRIQDLLGYQTLIIEASLEY